MSSSEKGDPDFPIPEKTSIEHIVIISQEGSNDSLSRLCQETWGDAVALDSFADINEALIALAGNVGVRADAIILGARLSEEDSVSFLETLTTKGGIHATIAVIREGDFDRPITMLEKGVLQLLPEKATPMQLMKAVCAATKTCLSNRRDQEEIKRLKVLNTLSGIESDHNLSLEQKFQAILKTLLALKSFGIANEGSIALYDRAKDELTIVAEQKLSLLVQKECRDTPRKPLQRLRSGQPLCICDWVALLGKHITVGSTQATITIPKEKFHKLFKEKATGGFPVPTIILPKGMQEEGENYVIVVHEGVQTPKKHGHMNYPIKLKGVTEGVLNLYTVEGKEETQDEESFFTFVTSVLERLLQRDRIEKELAKTEWAEARRLIIAEHASQPVFMLDATDENGRIIPSNVLARALLVKMSPFGDDPNIPALPLEALFFEPDKIPMKTMQSADEATYEIIDHVAVNQHIKDHFVDKTIEKRINGNVFTVEAKRITDESLGIDAIGIYLNDITEQKKGESQLARAQEIAHLGNWRWDIQNNNIQWSDEIYRIFGLKPSEIDLTYRSFLKMVHPDDHTKVKKAIKQATTKGASYEIEHRIIRPDGEIKWVRESGCVEKDTKGKLLYIDGTIQDITPMKTVEQQLEQIAKNDALTGILNQSGFHEKLETEMARAKRSKTNLALLLIDLDWFKSVNDNLGHNAGDAALVEVTNRLKAIGHRPSDAPARQGGDEFAMILPGTDLAGAQKVALAILESLLTDKIPTGKEGVFLGASIGIALFKGNESIEDFKGQADKAVYAVKKAGRTGACHGPKSEDQAHEWMVQGTDSIQKALEK